MHIFFHFPAMFSHNSVNITQQGRYEPWTDLNINMGVPTKLADMTLGKVA